MQCASEALEDGVGRAWDGSVGLAPWELCRVGRMRRGGGVYHDRFEQ